MSIEDKQKEKEKVDCSKNNNLKQPSNPAHDTSIVDPDIIVCENEVRMKAVSNMAKILDEPYVPLPLLRESLLIVIIGLF